MCEGRRVAGGALSVPHTEYHGAPPADVTDSLCVGLKAEHRPTASVTHDLTRCLWGSVRGSHLTGREGPVPR